MISILIPTYNESTIIIGTIQQIQNAISKTDFSDNYEIIVIDDHSSDFTFEKICDLQNTKIKVMRLSKRNGSHHALRAGMHHSTGEAVICLSADGQDDPKVIPQMIEKWKKDYQVVWAYRKNFSRSDESFLNKVTALLFYRILSLLTPSSPIDLSRADFFLADQKVVQYVNACQEQHTSLWGLISWSGFNQSFVEYVRKPRIDGESKWNFLSRWNLAKDWIIAFSGMPLRCITWLGFFIGLLGFLYAFFIMVRHFEYGESVAGWSSLMVVVLVLGGINMFLLGMIGEYLWRNLNETRHRPLYFIEKDNFTHNG